ncbi:hypothetical protein Q7A53_10850 [Halobacillus rhizosphaerae]|uniref:hypothetical protein n=1 Tax=Halobacillus rhizosphaerae TaxID=3064889 RepID=UPI00398A58AE
MNRPILFILCLLSVLSLMACQSNNFKLDKENVTSIEVRGWDTSEEFQTIKDQQVIADVVNGLNKSGTVDTSNKDFMMPEYRLQFKHDEETLYEMGYYTDPMKMGSKPGNFWDKKNGEFYEFEYKLTVKEQQDQ